MDTLNGAMPPADEGGEVRTLLPETLSPYFTGLVLDGDPALLDEGYALRYQVYCLERKFLSAGAYPTGREIDAFDREAIHLGVLNTQQAVVSTARLVEHGEEGFPLDRHCRLFPHETPVHKPPRQVVELSRLSVSRTYNRRAGDHFYSLQGATGRSDGPERRGGGEIVMTMMKAMYQASKRRGHTHWLAAMERSLHRLMARYGFPFRVIGPETDYYGLVAPYLLDLRDFDEVILSGRFRLLQEFLDGLEPQYRPDGRARGPLGR